MRALSGLGSAGTQADDAVSGPNLTTFAGQLGGVVRNANGLLNLLRATFPDVHVQIEENVPRWVFFSERAAIGRSASGGGARLGANVAIGEKVKDLSGKFRIKVGPLELNGFESCLPGGTGAAAIQRVVDAYVTDFLDYDVELVVQVEDIPPMVLGERRRRLGLNTWLGRPIPRYSRRLVHYGHAAATGSTPN
jgi:type VI secretion system protein ImpH